MVDSASIEEQLKEVDDWDLRLEIIDIALRPPEPQLLDTSVLQNLDWVDRQIEAGKGHWSEEEERALQSRFGVDHANDLLDLGSLYKALESRDGYPWLICAPAVAEAGLLRGSRGKSLDGLIKFLTDHQDGWGGDAYPGIARGIVLGGRNSRISPLILKGLGVATPEELVKDRGPIAFLPDMGDRMLASYALLANIPAILTTDRRTFWAHRAKLVELGVQVFRPSELLALYMPYWSALDSEFKKRADKS